jgi:nitrite reductase/ring-hydroxylating ferredoxin subunit
MAWTFAADCSDLADRDVIGVECEGRRLAIYRLEDGFFATSDSCPHLGGVLSEGYVVENYIECPVHFALFDIRTGAADGGITTKSVKTFETKVVDGKIYVNVEDQS